MADFEQAAELVRSRPDLSVFVGSRPDELVSLAEQRLGIVFPPTYRRFLREFGAGGFGAADFYGVIHPNFDASSVPDAVWSTLTDRADASLPATMVVVVYDGMGGADVLDTARLGKDRECPVVSWELGLISPENGREVLAADFGSYFLSKIEAEIEAELAS